MEHQGVSLLSPCTDRQHVLVSPAVDMDEELDSREVHQAVADHFLSEEELFELLEEVEAELEKTEAVQIEECLHIERIDQLDLEERISEFQQWEEIEIGDVTVVLCPLCSDARLVYTLPDPRFVCPNSMDGSCALDIPNPDRLLLDDLRERLRIALEGHASYCHDTLSFVIVNGDTDASRSGLNRRLVAKCSSCDTAMAIV